jgi:hypothetical protein
MLRATAPKHALGKTFQGIETSCRLGLAIAACSLLLAVLAGQPAQANPLYPPNVTIDDDVTIDDSNSYLEPPEPQVLSLEIVDGVDGATTVELVDSGVIGGFVEVRDTSHLVINGGQIQARTEVKDHATLTMRGGSIEPLIRLYAAVEAPILLDLQDSAVLNLHGAAPSLDYVDLHDSSVAHVYGHSFVVDGDLPTGTSPGSGVTVSGMYANNQPFSVFFSRDPGTAQVFLHSIPEPSILTLISVVAGLTLGLTRRHQCRRMI